MIYLDHQASSPTHPAVVAAMHRYFTDDFANPHASDHAAGWTAADAIEIARGKVANAISADPDEIVFTSGATEANNLAILGLKDANPERKRIVVSAIEHKAVIAPARALTREGFDLVLAPVDGSGRVDLERLAELVDRRTLLVSIMLVNNEMGAVQPIEEVASICRSTGAFLHTDAAQALSWMQLDTLSLDADLISLSAHKASGPKGIGALYASREVQSFLRPIIAGGEQERGLRAGTLPTPLCVGMGEACELIPGLTAVDEWRTRTHGLWRGLQSVFPRAKLIGDEIVRHPGNLCVRLPDVDAEQFIALLQPDVALARGSACTSGIPEPSHVLSALGLTSNEAAEVIRLSTGPTTTASEIEVALECFERVAQRMKIPA